MFKISLKDVGKKRVTREFTVDIVSLDDAVSWAVNDCISLLGRDDFVVSVYDGGQYVLSVGKCLFGSFTILKL